MKIKDILPKKPDENLDEGLKQNVAAASIAALLAMSPPPKGNNTQIDLDHPTQEITQAVVDPGQKKADKPFYKIGAEYSKKGVKYKPHHDPKYKATGVASWYGPGFHGKKTANNDVFNTNDMTAAHPTLPLPSKVWVTNLENGKKVLVTVTDRGPYANGRLIDLSNAAAEALGYIHKGTAKVKVEYDQAETEKYLKEKGLYDQYAKIVKNKINKPEPIKLASNED